MTLNIKHTDVFTWNNSHFNDPSVRFIINQGGSRSSKTYSIIQLLILYCLTNKNKIVSIVRMTMPALKSTAMRDFFEVLRDLGLYKRSKHNRSNNVYEFDNGTVIEFFSIDEEQKLRGRKRNVLWANEANELNLEEYIQLNIRTTEKILFDFNPSDNEHWLYDLMERDNCKLIKSSYKDNPFLDEDSIKEIEYLIKTDENYYKIYALGERPISTTRVYNHFQQYDTILEPVNDIVYGLDFGYNHPTVLIKVHITDGGYYCEEIIYKSFLTSNDIVKLFAECNVDKNKYIYADYARPEIIQDLRRAGYNMKEANKEVKAGIDSVKKNPIYIYKNSLNTLKEYKMYNWKTNKDIVLEEPIKLYDDSMDAIRYAIHSSIKLKHNSKAVNVYVPNRLNEDW